jgi:Family of unknown function (DUF6152)
MTSRMNCVVILSFVLAVLLSGIATAHHNMSAVYDFNDRVTLTGTLTKVDWRNPHMELVIDAKREAGEVESWKGEGPAPLFFKSRDIEKADFDKAVGKTMTIEVSRARDGSHSGLLRNITMPDGKIISLCPQNC